MRTDWPDRRLQDLLRIAHPILQAPMAGAQDAALAITVAQAGGLGGLPCAMLSPAQIETQVAAFRAAVPGAPLNLNFFCHRQPAVDAAREAAWRQQLAPYYAELGAEPGAGGGPARLPFDAALCALVERLRPEVLSFHFGLPDEALLARVKACGATVLSSATTVREGRWLAARGCDAVIAQGLEAGGHRGHFLSGDLDVGGQPGLFALLPQLVDAVPNLPVIAAGGIGDARGIAAAFALGAAGVQLGTAYLFCPEARIAPLHRAALETAGDDSSVLTNLFSGRPARSLRNRVIDEVGAINPVAPSFPQAGAALAPLRARAEAAGDAGFQSLWSGQAAALAARDVSAGELTRKLATEALALIGR